MDLETDTFALDIFSPTLPAWLYGRSSECEKCAYVPLTHATHRSGGSNITLNSRYPWTLRWRSSGGNNEWAPYQSFNDKELICQYDEILFAEYGKYKIVLSNGSDCQVQPEGDYWPSSSYLPILYSSIFYLCLAVGSCLTIYGTRKFHDWKTSQKRHENDASPATDLSSSSPQKMKRLASLDTFRGLSIIVMIFVNGGGGGYWFFQHATWDGLLVADLVFPWFIWIMGVCIPMSITGQLKRKEARWTIFKGILRRSATLFSIGLCLGSRGQPIETLRIPGVLQRFAICYLFSATLVLLSSHLTHQKESEGSSVFNLTDVTKAWPHWVAIFVLSVTHTGITFGLPVPGCPTGYLGPAGLHDNASYPDFCIGGATGYIDKILLTESHIYKFPTAREVYKSGSFDPEGILGSVTSIIQTLLGVQTGITILTFKDKKRRLASWLSFAILFGLLGGALCNFTQYGGIIPVNKNLWSISYVLVTTCFALIILSVFYLLIDVYNIWNGAPLIFPGKNSIVMYVGHSLCYNMLPWNWSYGKMNNHDWLYAECLWGTTMWVILAYWMNKKRIFFAL